MICCPFEDFAQLGDNANLYKYWLYRKRFNNEFIVNGYVPPNPDGTYNQYYGYSIPFGGWIWKIETDPDLIALYGTAYREVGNADGSINLGWHLAILATEYALLQKRGLPVDETLAEMYMQ